MLQRTWTTVGLLSEALAVTSFKLSPVEASGELILQSGLHTLMISEFVGECDVVLEALCAYTSKACHGFEIPFLPMCSQTNVRLTLKGEPHRVVTVEPSLQTTSESRGSTVASAVIPPTNRLSVRWTSAAGPSSSRAAAGTGDEVSVGGEGEGEGVGEEAGEKDEEEGGRVNQFRIWKGLELSVEVTAQVRKLTSQPRSWKGEESD